MQFNCKLCYGHIGVKNNDFAVSCKIQKKIKRYTFEDIVRKGLPQYVQRKSDDREIPNKFFQQSFTNITRKMILSPLFEPNWIWGSNNMKFYLCYVM